MRYTLLPPPKDILIDLSPSLFFDLTLRQAVDDPSAWPFVHGRAADVEEVAAICDRAHGLKRGLASLKAHTSVASRLNAGLGRMIEVHEDESYGTLRYQLPAVLISFIQQSLTLAELELDLKAYEEAVAHLRVAEVLLRLAKTWGQAELENFEAGLFGLPVGGKAQVLVATEVVTSAAGNEVRRTIQRY